MGAVGPTQFLVAVNGRIRSFDKATGVPDTVLDVGNDSFFVGQRNGSPTTDPRVRYDRATGRWFITMLNIPSGSPLSNRIMVAYSDRATLTNATNFTEIFFDDGALHPGCGLDYDGLGIDRNALYIGANLFCGPNLNSATFTQTEGFVFSKAALLSGSPTVVDFTISGNPGPNGINCTTPGSGPDGVYAPEGVDNTDPAATFGYFAGSSVCFFGELVFVRISNPGSNTPGGVLTEIGVADTNFPMPAPALGSTNPLSTVDDRVFNAVLRNGHLWLAQNMCVDATGVAPVGACPGTDRDGIRWYDITNNDTTPSQNQTGTAFDSAVSNPLFYFFPSINVSGQGHVAMGSSESSAAVHPEAASMGRLSTDALGTMQAPTTYQASTFSYNLGPGNPQRWGDYSYTSVDPSDDMTMWTIQEYANATDSWGVEVVKLVAPPPATPSGTDGTTIFTDQCSQTIQVTGTATSGSGFFDPGAGFPNHLTASVSGGVTVNRVTYIDPTHFNLDISTQGVSTGLKNLTVTNPDGQAVTVNNFLSVTGSSTNPDGASATSVSQYSLSNSDGSTWQEIDPALRIACAPAASQYTLLGANADLWTGSAGFNQDIGIFVSDNGGTDTLLAWKESGGFAGTSSPNAAYAQSLYHMVSGHAYVFKLKWKTNKNAPGTFIAASAGLPGNHSPTSLVAEVFPTGTVPNFVKSPLTSQYSLSNSNGTTWQPIDDPNLSTILSPGADSTAVLGANSDLWTGSAGFNQDLGIFVSDNGGADALVAWKESGGFAGTSSPNAAFVKATYAMTGTHTYVFKLKWKTNKDDPGGFIAAGAGLPGNFSPTSLVAQTIPSGANPYHAETVGQYSLSNSNGVTWQPIDAALNVTVAPGSNTNSIIGANADLWTGSASFNQDIGIFVSVDSGADTLVAWKESGGFAGTSSPNAAFAQATYTIVSGHTYVFKLMWKTNKNDPGGFIAAAAGLPGNFSPTRLTVELTN
jgi:hypothetical protein